MNSILKRLNEKAARQKIPIMAALELLPVCNLQCKMCYVRKSMAQVQALGGLKDAQWWLELARQAQAEGLLSPLLTGGEPFLHPQFCEIFSGMEQMGLQISINSNATLLDAPMVAWLEKHRPVRINITLYGASAQTYERLCGQGAAFEKVCSAVERLQAAGIPVKFNTSVTPENVQDLPQILEFARAHHAPLEVATYMFPPIRRDEGMIGQNDRLPPEEAALARVRADFQQSEPLWFVGQALRYARFVPLDKLAQQPRTEAPMSMTCRAGLCSFWIDWQGNMMNCGMHGSVQIPMQGRAFRDCWQELVEKTAQVRFAPGCGSCPNRPLCHPCVAMVHNECGGYSGRPDYICLMQQAQAQLYQEFARKHYPELLVTAMPNQEEEDCGF